MKLVQTRTEPTPAEALLLAQETRAENALNALHIATVESFREFWHGSTPPADLLTIMGTNAAPAFEQHARTVAFLLASGVEIAREDYTPPLPYTVHNDGTVTLD